MRPHLNCGRGLWEPVLEGRAVLVELVKGRESVEQTDVLPAERLGRVAPVLL